MSEMLKRVAQAICCPGGVCQGRGGDVDHIAGRVSICQAHTYELEAIAAIAAMREPTGEIVRAGVHEWSPELNHKKPLQTDPVFDAYFKDVADSWRTMIDAALSDHS